MHERRGQALVRLDFEYLEHLPILVLRSDAIHEQDLLSTVAIEVREFQALYRLGATDREVRRNELLALTKPRPENDQILVEQGDALPSAVATHIAEDLSCGFSVDSLLAQHAGDQRIFGFREQLRHRCTLSRRTRRHDDPCMSRRREVTVPKRSPHPHTNTTTLRERTPWDLGFECIAVAVWGFHEFSAAHLRVANLDHPWQLARHAGIELDVIGPIGARLERKCDRQRGG